MTGEELKQALLSEQPVIFSQMDGSETEYKQVSAIVYRKKKDRISVSAEVQDKNGRSVCLCDPKRLRLKGGA